MRRKVLAVVAGVVAVGVGLLGAWRWGPLADEQVVPSCGDLAEALPSAVDGSWTLTRTEPNREVIRSIVRCEFGFRSADQAYRGKVVVNLSAGDDEAALRKTATDGPCYGEAVPNPGGARYVVARSCSEKINDKIFAAVFVASDERYAHTLVEFSSSSLPLEQVVTYANTSAQRITDHAMTLKANDSLTMKHEEHVIDGWPLALAYETTDLSSPPAWTRAPRKASSSTASRNPRSARREPRGDPNPSRRVAFWRAAAPGCLRRTRGRRERGPVSPDDDSEQRTTGRGLPGPEPSS